MPDQVDANRRLTPEELEAIMAEKARQDQLRQEQAGELSTFLEHGAAGNQPKPDLAEMMSVNAVRPRADIPGITREEVAPTQPAIQSVADLNDSLEKGLEHVVAGKTNLNPEQAVEDIAKLLESQQE